MLHPLWEMIWQLLLKLEAQLPRDLSLPLLHIWSGRGITSTQRLGGMSSFTDGSPTWTPPKGPSKEGWCTSCGLSPRDTAHQEGRWGRDKEPHATHRPLNTVSVSSCRVPHGPKTEWLKAATKLISASVGQESRSGPTCCLQLCVARDTAAQTSAGLWSSEGPAAGRRPQR